VGMICLYFTGSRTGLIAFFVGLAVFLASMSERKIMCMITVALIGIFTYASFFPDSVVELASRVFPRSVLITEGLELRFELWNIALRQINKQPFIGTGLFTYRKYIPVNASYRIAGTIHAHNIFINFWLETGLPGVISFIWILVKVLKRAFDQLKDSPFRPYLAAVIAMISITVMHGMNDAPLISSQTIIFFGIFLGISCTG
ncbi:MAG: O-antigen ligase family protein, partial [Saccharofermentanales bacterium]